VQKDSYSNSEDIYKTRHSLLERVKLQHDERSWDEFVQTYRPYVYTICKRMNLSHHDAEDITQQSIVKIWGKLPDFAYNDRKSFRAWVGSVTRNTANDFFRKQNRQAKVVSNYSKDDLAVKPITESEIVRIAEEEWKRYLVTLAMEKITAKFPKKAIAVFMELQRGTPRKSVAQKYKLTPDSVSAYKGRVLSALYATIRELEETL
jgi:RNA polymerase sigma factor (sigma-70 family)